MSHLVCGAHLFDGGCRVAATNDGSGTILCALCQYLNKGICTPGKCWHLRHTERTIPYDSLCIFKSLTESCNSCRADVPNAPAMGNLVNGNNFRGCVGSEAV